MLGSAAEEEMYIQVVQQALSLAEEQVCTTPEVRQR